MQEYSFASLLYEASDFSTKRKFDALTIPVINNMFSLIDSGAEEQVAFFPFNINNPIYLAHGITPVLDSISIPNHNWIALYGELINKSNEIMLRINLDMKWDDILGFEIRICNVQNYCASAENKYRNVGVHFINSVQNFFVYSENQNKITLSTINAGNHYWAKWFDFDYKHFDISFKIYRDKFLLALKEQGLYSKEVVEVTKTFRHPIEFRTLQQRLLHKYDIGRIGMEWGTNWSGKCSLKEMSNDHLIRRVGLEMLSDRGIKPIVPTDFQKVIKKKLSESVR